MDAAEKLLLTFLVLAAVATLVFIVVAWSTRLPEQEQAEVQHQGYVIRSRWFLGLMLFLLATFFATIPFFPYLAAASALLPAQKVPVITQQFVFLMPDHFPLNRRILFAVTSHDVNHGFGIYNPEGQLIAQTQAMPDYVNYLAVTFHQPGQYTVRCLEYCGVGHAVMEKDFTVGNDDGNSGSSNNRSGSGTGNADTNEINNGNLNGGSNPFE